jgi:hypothetical protein
MKYVIPSAIAIGVGLLVLLGYLVPDPILFSIRLALTDWAVILAGLAVLTGLLNLLLVHSRRIQTGDRGWVYSIFTLLAALFTLVVGVLESYGSGSPSLYREGSVIDVLFRGVAVPSLAALASLVMFFLVVAAVRMLRNRPNGWSVVFLIAAVITLAGWIPLSYIMPVNSFRQWLLGVPAAAGARGILLGVALGTVIIGIRVLTGVERPYKD